MLLYAHAASWFVIRDSYVTTDASCGSGSHVIVDRAGTMISGRPIEHIGEDLAVIGQKIPPMVYTITEDA